MGKMTTSKVGVRSVNAALDKWLASIGAEDVGPAIVGARHGLNGEIRIMRTPRGRMLVVLVYENAGWDVLTGHPGNGVIESLADARKRLGLGV